jgi:hypothetical protein
MICALLVESVSIVVGRLGALPLVAPGGPEPAFGSLLQHAIRKVVCHPGERGDDGECVGSVLFPSKHRKLQFRNDRMPHFVRHHEQHVADQELDAGTPVARGKLLEDRLARERDCLLIDARLKFRKTRLDGSRIRLSRLGKQGARAEAKSQGQRIAEQAQPSPGSGPCFEHGTLPFPLVRIFGGGTIAPFRS